MRKYAKVSAATALNAAGINSAGSRSRHANLMCIADSIPNATAQAKSIADFMPRFYPSL